MRRSSVMLVIGIVAMISMAGVGVVQTQLTEGYHSREKSRSTTDGQPTRATQSREREAPDLSLVALCGQITKSLQTGYTDEVHQSIRSNLRHLSADEILSLLGRLDATACRNVGNMMEVLLLDLLAKLEPSITSDYMLAKCGAGDIHWDFFSISFFDDWVRKDIEAATTWLDRQHLNLPSDGSVVVISRAETALISRLIQTDPQAALDRLVSFPMTLAHPVIDFTFRRNTHLLAPDQAIEFLREALGGEDHEALVGYVCGLQLYSKGVGSIQDFFRKHDATLLEREAIIRESVTMEVNMGYGGDDEAFLLRSRDFAEQEGPGALDHITAVILGIIASRDREDRKAVDTLLAFDPDDEALRTFLDKRGESIDKTQRQRIQERLNPR